MKLGFIGLGAMGIPMSQRLLDAAYALHIYDVVEAAVAALAANGARRCASPRAVAENSQIVFSSLPNAAIVGKVMRGETGVFAGASAGKVVIDLSSVDPYSTKQLAAEAAGKKFEYIDAPVSGGVAGAVAGTLTIMVGAGDDCFKKVEPLLNILGKKIIHVGEVGAGDAVKIVNNMLLGANMAALAEALVLGRKAGLKAQTMYDIIKESSGRSYVLETKMPNFIMKDNFESGFAVDLMYKDLGLAIETAKTLNMPVPVINMVQQVYEMARAKGYGRQDMSSVVKIWAELMDTKIQD